MAGSVLVAGIAGLSVLVVGLILGVPLTPLLALWVAIFDLVPQIGGAAGGIPFVLLGLTQGITTGAHLRRVLRPLPAVREPRPRAR